MNKTNDYWIQGRIALDIGAPWELNFTYSQGLMIAMHDIDMADARPLGRYTLRMIPNIGW